ncbi:hydroxyacid dehydrogenase [Clostridioides difficile]|uniref:four-carbon acid sugar kinase family protein n=1 Tax=Clostridioides difficile TaxID=1496 RepID=UPI00097FEF3A|nr:four-carbon acid sugar kinase family protein [Clostridioides difficile]MBH7279231.1 hydroxyacid dehydrogenase [Clostridioides difficile]MBH7344595.1 hydroxyacid dehydrogenase [Clostridioides difficile]SJW04758.1 hydroxyacid dehydrogenase/reductase-like protein [Clostridioides difficile]HBF3783777.1 hydroxyacid dehydrogenase [Clostridioides difficile]HBF5864288.1 hydroxyacid dehydrogenase [Clostridioides difficile]
MREVKPISIDILNTFKQVDEDRLNKLLADELKHLDRKIVVLDDDPTGVQTVHDISVYTDWDKDSMEQGFNEKNSMFFILTNSRGFTVTQTTKVHKEISRNIVDVSKKVNKDFIIISRSDSTMRGHYPVETNLLKSEVERLSGKLFDGEIIMPFFKEGGRFTIDNVHYVKEGEMLVPAGMTEFAKDKSFGYKSSHIGEWCEEKTNGKYKSSDMIYISSKELRELNIEAITEKLKKAEGFNKIIVNATDYVDVKVFTIAFIRAVNSGKEFMFRSAAAITKVLGGVSDKELLTKDELVSKGNTNGGIILVGSHVNKTTQQLEELKNCKYPIEFIEFNQHLVLQENGLKNEVKRVIKVVEEKISRGKTVAVYTRRERFDLDTNDKDKQLMISVEISDAVTSIIGMLNVRPNFIIAKGGITSSDVGTKALRVKKATVMGQIKPGIPVWMTGKESKFPNMPYIIFPGNVGEISTLRESVEILMG